MGTSFFPCCSDNKIKKRQIKNEDNMSVAPISSEKKKNTPNFPIYPEFKPEVIMQELSNIPFEKKPQNIYEDKKQEVIKQTKSFYDLILDFSKFDQLYKGGWKIIWGKEGKEKYEKCKKNDNVVVGVIGNKNKGKSFLLSKFINKENFSNNEHGFLVTTKGISANFPVLEDEGENATNVITLDTAGKDNPLLDVSNNIDAPDSLQRKIYENEEIKNIARDQRISEIVLSDFIIQEADVLITVLEQLSFAEQEMLKNLLNQLKSKKSTNNNLVNPKKLIVIHNLMNLTDVNSINRFIDNVLLKSFTFKLYQRKLQIIKKENGIDDTKRFCYIQKTKDIDNLEIFHLIFGNDSNSEIRKEFNEPGIRFIRDAIEGGTQKEFDLIENFKNFITTNSIKYLNGSGLSQDSLLIEKESDIPKAIILKDPKTSISLKGVLVNSNGIADFFATIEPNYSSKILKEEDQYFLEIIFEMFGKLQEDIKISKGMQKMKHVITIEGKVVDPNEIECKNVQGNLKFTSFFFQIIIDKFFEIKNDKNEESEKFNLADIYEDKKNTTNDDDYGIYNIKMPIKVVKIINKNKNNK